MASTTYSYDPAGQLTRLANVKSDDSVISTFDYSYDKVGNRTGVVEANGDHVTWSYDKTYQLIREQRSGDNSYYVTHTYDPAGNRSVKNENGSCTTFTYDTANQLETSLDNSGTTTYTYDSTGNLTVQNAPIGRTTHTWDAENHLIIVKTPDNIVNTMTYRADGLRVAKQDSTGTSKFIWDGKNILHETDSNGTTQATYTLQSFEYGNLLSQFRNETSSFYHFDAIGATDSLTDSAQAVSDYYKYKAYGEMIDNGSSIVTVNPFLWAGCVGYFEDSELKQYYVRTRHYKPGLVRWLSADPIGFSGSEFNLFQYSNSQPVGMTDPSGLSGSVGGAPIVINVQIARILTQMKAAQTCCQYQALETQLFDLVATAMAIAVTTALRKRVRAWLATMEISPPICVAPPDAIPEPTPIERPEPRPEPGPGTDPPPVPPDKGDSCTCATKYPGYVSCDNYEYYSYAEALLDNFPRNCKSQAAKAKSCGDGGGTHYNIKNCGQFLGSIICCVCCDDDPFTGKPELYTKCNAQ